MADRDFGGLISMRLSTGELFSLRGTLNLNPAGQTNEPITNQDGSVDRIGTPVARRFEFTFKDDGIDYDALMRSDRFNVTFHEDFTGVTHLYTGAFVVGDPTINRLTGEVTGLSGASSGYVKTGG